MRIWIMLLMLAFTALAGCADGSEETDDTDAGDGSDNGSDGSGDGGSGGDGTDTGGDSNATNTPPTAELSADVVNGTAPLRVNLTIEGSDADGDNLTWTLSQNGTEAASGETLPSTLNVTLGVGDHTFVLSVTDAVNSTTADLTVAVSEATPTETGPATHPEPIFQESHMIEGCELCIDSEIVTDEQMGAAGCVGWNLGENEVDCAWVEIPDGYAGFPWSAFSYTDGNIPEFGSDGDVDIEFFDGCSSDASSMGIIREASFGEPESGIVPEGAKCMVGFEFSWPNAGHTIEFSVGEIVH